MNCINTDYFKPFLQAFCEKTQPLYTCGYPWGPFVPYTMPRYNDADVKIFYMSRSELEDICICHAVHDICTHKPYSIPDLLRMNDFWVEAEVTFQHFASQTNE